LFQQAGLHMTLACSIWLVLTGLAMFVLRVTNASNALFIVCDTVTIALNALLLVLQGNAAKYAGLIYVLPAFFFPLSTGMQLKKHWPPMSQSLMMIQSLTMKKKQDVRLYLYLILQQRMIMCPHHLGR
jgi:hypothetical protein